MRKFLLFCGLLIIFFLGFFLFNRTHRQPPIEKKSSVLPTVIQPTNNKREEKISLFVPYWTLSDNLRHEKTYASLIYFGIIPNEQGIDTTGEAYAKLPNFVSYAGTNRKLLTVQMTNSSLNAKILQDKALQQKIMEQSLSIGKEHHFDGIILDFEFSALAFPSVTESVTNFIIAFSKKTHERNVSFAITMYGDVFYRARPYDLAALGKHADEILIMAYDFHKAKGDPGANFPLENEDYNFQTMIDDFLKKVPKEKLTVIFGMYGYDWKVGEKGQSITQATSLSLNEIKQKFLTQCSFKNCKITRDPVSAETKITYTDEENDNHVVWFEDEQSIEKKKTFLKTRGIFSTSMWAYSYF